MFPPRERFAEVRAKHGCDLAITGSPYYRPFPPPHYQAGFAGPRRDLALAALEAGFSVGLYGPKTWVNRRHGGDPRLAPHYRGWIEPSKIHLVHWAASVVLGTHLVTGPRYDSGRLPWVLGAGGCLLHELRAGLREEFGDAVAWYRPGDTDGFLANLRALKADPERRQRMRTKGREIVLARHTWAHRAQRLIDIVNGPV
jgi:glycosyltransferase involved in cell wall biosynthesis